MLVLIRNYEMVFVTALLVLCVPPYIRSVKVLIDGTIDFGPNWNFEYKINPINLYESTKTLSDNPNVLNSEDADIKTPEGKPAIIAETIEDIEKSIKHVRTLAQDDGSHGLMNGQRGFEVTKLYKLDVKTDAIFIKPRQIKEETKVVQFVDHIKNQSLKMFDDVREKLDNKAFVQKLDELKQRYVHKFNEFENNTKHHTIRTAFGDERVILNTIDYSNKLLNRLVNRFKVDIGNSGLRSGFEASKTFQEHKDTLKNVAYEDACEIFSICRAGKEFSDHISELITKLLEHDDTKVKLAVEATATALKAADFSRIMDSETRHSFTKGLSILEELNPFELRVLLIAYKLLIDNRHQPFQNSDPKTPWVRATVAMFHVMEGFNKKVILHAQHWNTVKRDLDGWLGGEDVNIQHVAKQLVDRVQNKIRLLDDETAEDFKSQLRLCVAAKSLRVHLSNYVQFQPFVI